MPTLSKTLPQMGRGKSQLLAQLDQHLPESLDEREFTYIEPFVGGGAMLFK